MPEDTPTTTTDLPHEAPLPTDGEVPATGHDDEPLVVGDLLVEDVSIDGMCGVY